MLMTMDVVWQENGDVEFRIACGECAFTSALLHSEDAALAAYFAHACSRSATKVFA